MLACLRSRVPCVALVAIALLVLGVASPASADRTTWTSEADFAAGILEALDATSVPGSLRLAWSPGWVKFEGNPVLGPGDPGSWDETSTNSLSVVYEAGAYRMWYAGCSGISCGIGHATSPDGVAWVKDPANPVIAGGIIQNPYVLRVVATYHMWFAVNTDTIRIGHATSPDGVAWTVDGGPVLEGTPGTWDGAAVSTPAVLVENATFTMYYSGHGGSYSYSIGRATSPDGVNWTKDPSNPVMTYGGGWEGDRVHPLEVLRLATGYGMYYVGDYYAPQVGYATSVDGRSWTRAAGNPVLRVGTPGEWDSARLGDIGITDPGSGERLWYVGGSGGSLSIGLADLGTTYASFGAFTSAVFDSSSAWTTWNEVGWSGTPAANGTLVVSVRFGDAPDPNSSWTPWSNPSSVSPARIGTASRYIQVLVAFFAFDTSRTPVLDELWVDYTPPAPYRDPALWVLPLFLGVPAVVGGVAAWLLVRRRRAAPR